MYLVIKIMKPSEQTLRKTAQGVSTDMQTSCNKVVLKPIVGCVCGLFPFQPHINDVFINTISMHLSSKI